MTLEDGHLVMDWLEGPDQKIKYTDPLPLTPTKARHPAFAFTDWLKNQDMITVGFDKFEKLNLQILAENNMYGYPQGYDQLDGKWHHDLNNIIISVTDSNGGTSTYNHLWKEVAKQTAWPGKKLLK
ncbi:hypothetical protein [Kiloniella sp.]|uniref:hypothetical protein n=1 Tax=Kiloniella sp. TaxID=1938587 RepID=UPI003B02B5BF